jgi:hypothetical protein
MPLRISHSKQGLWDKRDPRTGKPPKPEIMNGRRFDLPVFLRKVAQRLEQMNIIDPRIAPEADPPTSPQVAENHLCWCDVSLFVTGFPTLHRSLLRHLAKTDRPLLLASDNGLDKVWITSRPTEDPNLVRKQLTCHDNEAWRLEISRALVSAKLKNYATLA